MYTFVDTYMCHRSFRSCCDTEDNSVVYAKCLCIELRLFYTITAEEEKGEWTKNEEEDDCKRNCVCEGPIQHI